MSAAIGHGQQFKVACPRPGTISSTITGENFWCKVLSFAQILSFKVVSCLNHSLLFLITRYFEAGVDLRTREIFVLRTESFEHDWKILDAMLGGKGTAPKHLHENKSEKYQMFVNNTVSAKGVNNLCRALCKEIRTYAEILENAVNLDANDVHETLATLRAQCPDQVDQRMTLCE